MRYLLLLLTVMVLVAALYLTGLYGLTPYATIQAELELANERGWAAILPRPLPHLAYTAARYALLRSSIGVALGGAVLGLLVLGKRSSLRELQHLRRDIARAWQSLSQFWHSLSWAEQATSAVVLLLVLGLRLWFQAHSAFNPDELVSSDYFARPGPRVAACFYTLPNNHILYNLMSSYLLRMAPANANPELLLRLPSLLLGFIGTGLVYAVLARLTSLRVATFLVCFVQLAPEAVGYNVVARGYGLQAACAYGLFLAVLVLLRGPAYHRLAWTVAVAASVAGFYLIPTFIYPFLSLGTGLLIGLVGRRCRRARIRQATVGSGGVLLLVGLLYLPVGLLSGWASLLANPYVERLTAAHFWSNFGPYYLWGTIGVLFGNQLVTVPLLLLLSSGGLLLIRRWAPPAWWPAAALAWAGLLGPLPMLVLQGVFAPPRTLHYVVLFAGLLSLLFFEAVVRRLRISARLAWVVLSLGLAGYATYRIPRQIRTLFPDHELSSQAQHVYQWFRTQRPRPILTDAYGYNLYLRHLALVQGQAPLPVQLLVQRPIVAPSAYLMLVKGSPLPGWVARPYHLVYEHEYLVVYQLM